MNRFGKNFRIQIFGESHGPCVGITIDGVLPGIPLSSEDFTDDINRRRGGTAIGTTSRKEDDQPKFLSGIFNGRSTGAPLTIIFENNDIRSKDYDQIRQVPRPGHADFVAGKKYLGYQDYRGGGHFSGRLTLCLVAAGVVARKLMRELKTGSNIKCEANLLEVGGMRDIEAGIQRALDLGDSVGGLVECRVQGLPVGLGEPFFDSLESLISHAVFSIPAIRGIEFGTGFAAAGMTGASHNDLYLDETGRTATNHAGGISGGISNGNELLFRVAVKPTSSTPKEQMTFNPATGEMEPLQVKGRHDLCIALRVPVVLEAVTNCVLADMLIEQSAYRIN